MLRKRKESENRPLFVPHFAEPVCTPRLQAGKQNVLKLHHSSVMEDITRFFEAFTRDKLKQRSDKLRKFWLFHSYYRYSLLPAGHVHAANHLPSHPLAAYTGIAAYLRTNLGSFPNRHDNTMVQLRQRFHTIFMLDPTHRYEYRVLRPDPTPSNPDHHLPPRPYAPGPARARRPLPRGRPG